LTETDLNDHELRAYCKVVRRVGWNRELDRERRVDLDELASVTRAERVRRRNNRRRKIVEPGTCCADWTGRSKWTCWTSDIRRKSLRTSWSLRTCRSRDVRCWTLRSSWPCRSNDALRTSNC
jgi:hypothetical protein